MLLALFIASSVTRFFLKKLHISLSNGDNLNLKNKTNFGLFLATTRIYLPIYQHDMVSHNHLDDNWMNNCHDDVTPKGMFLLTLILSKYIHAHIHIMLSRKGTFTFDKKPLIQVKPLANITYISK